MISNPSWTGLTSFTAHLYHFGRRWSSLFSYFQSKVDSYWLMWCVKLDGLICWHSLKWTVKGDSWVYYMIYDPNWTIKSERFDFLGEPSSKKQKLMITWLLTVRQNAFDPLSNCSNWSKSVFWIVWSHVIVNSEEKIRWIISETACIFITWLSPLNSELDQKLCPRVYISKQIALTSDSNTENCYFKIYCHALQGY